MLRSFLQSLTPTTTNWATTIWFNDSLAPDFFALNFNNPFCPSSADIWLHNNAFCSCTKVSNSEVPLLSSSTALPPLFFLLSNVTILSFPHPVRHQSHLGSVTCMIKNSSLDLAVHGINLSIKFHWKSQLKGLQGVNLRYPSNSCMVHILGCHVPKKSFSKTAYLKQSPHLGKKGLLLGSLSVYFLLHPGLNFTLFMEEEGEGEDEEGGDWLRLSIQPIWAKISTLK